MNKKKVSIIGIIVILIAFTGTYAIIESQRERIILATTTSTYDSGLLDELIPVFEKETGIRVEVLAVGTGQALALGEAGDADVLLVHARLSEDEFVANGYGVHRVCVMYNDFLIVGPSSDPAGISGSNITIALNKLKTAGEASWIEFYSRGDNSGTNKKELQLWNDISYTPDSQTDSWYKETGAGMGSTITITNENGGYTMIDRGTWLTVKENMDLESLVEGDEILLNPYGAILVNNETHEGINFDGARKFVGFLVSEQGQDLISAFRKNNEVLFNPAFGICNQTHSCETTNDETEYWLNYNGGWMPTASV